MYSSECPCYIKVFPVYGTFWIQGIVKSETIPFVWCNWFYFLQKCYRVHRGMSSEILTNAWEFSCYLSSLYFDIKSRNVRRVSKKQNLHKRRLSPHNCLRNNLIIYIKINDSSNSACLWQFILINRIFRKYCLLKTKINSDYLKVVKTCYFWRLRN